MSIVWTRCVGTLLTCCVVAISLAGCNTENGDKKESTVTAAGILTYKGQPLEYHQIYLQSEGKRAATALTGSDGRFQLGTNQAGDGAPAGRQQVAVVYAGPPVLEGDAAEVKTPPPKVKIPPKYQRAETSGLTLEIPPGGSSDLKIELQ